MEKIDLPFFYQLGARLFPITEYDLKSNNKLGFAVLCIHARSNVKILLERFTTLTVCRVTGEELLKAFQDVISWLVKTEAEKLNKPDTTADALCRNTITKAKQFEIVLSAELQTMATYHATQKGIYSTTDLIEKAEYILPLNVIIKVSKGIREEIRHSGRCLAFDNATASAFHMMRATESIIRDYYISVCKPESKKALSNWGAYIKKLQQSEDPEVKEVVVLLQQIKDRHRNLIMHPEVVLSPDEAFTLFEIAQGAIITMADKLPIIKEK